MFLDLRLATFFLLFWGLFGCAKPSSSDLISAPAAEVADQCLGNPNDIAWIVLLEKNCHRLSDYGLFESGDPRVNPRSPGLKYSIATELFTDYAKKYRFLFVPNQQSIKYQARASFEFPVGSVLSKTFVLPLSNQGEGVDMVETRLFIRREQGWIGLPYVWNAQKTEAFLSITGARIEKTMVIDGVGITFDYEVPSIGDCRTCHLVRTDEASKTVPIGLKSQHLNRNIEGQRGAVNQLRWWENQKLLTGLPKNRASLLSVPLWSDDSRSLQDRAKGYLDINCSHCHSPGGSGSESGMFLEYWRLPEYFDHGICKRPGGFNGGDKGLVYDLVPGNAAESLIPYRMSLLASEGNEKGQMPPLSRHINHIEGIQLVQRWINNMVAKPCR